MDTGMLKIRIGTISFVVTVVEYYAPLLGLALPRVMLRCIIDTFRYTMCTPYTASATTGKEGHTEKEGIKAAYFWKGETKEQNVKQQL